jgi:Raf kinase inhibitor-like YbhB/YbcL family protein
MRQIASQVDSKTASLAALAVLLSIASAGLSLAQQAPPAAGAPPAGAGAGGRGGAPPPPFRIMSPDMVDGSLLPQQFTCAAGTEAVSPPLQWVNAPRGTVSFALIVHDMEPRPQKKLDDILHWMVWNIPATATRFPQGVPSNTADLPDGSHQTNGNPGQGGITGYRPPCPPQNVPLPHHYAFDMFALDTKVDLPETATRADVMKVMDGHILGHDSLVVPFNR